MSRTVRMHRRRRLVTGCLACYLLALLVVPLVHNDVACGRSPTRCGTCALNGMAAAPAGRSSSVHAPQPSASGLVRLASLLPLDTILPARHTGRSPPDLLA